MRYSVLIFLTLKVICVLKDLEIRGTLITNGEGYLTTHISKKIHTRNDNFCAFYTIVEKITLSVLMDG